MVLLDFSIFMILDLFVMAQVNFSQSINNSSKINVLNYADHEGRYAFEKQPSVCKWNLEKLAESIAALLPLQFSKAILEEEYDSTYNDYFFTKMRRKV